MIGVQDGDANSGANRNSQKTIRDTLMRIERNEKEKYEICAVYNYKLFLFFGLIALLIFYEKKWEKNKS